MLILSTYRRKRTDKAAHFSYACSNRRPAVSSCAEPVQAQRLVVVNAPPPPLGMTWIFFGLGCRVPLTESSEASEGRDACRMNVKMSLARPGTPQVASSKERAVDVWDWPKPRSSVPCTSQTTTVWREMHSEVRGVRRRRAAAGKALLDRKRPFLRTSQVGNKRRHRCAPAGRRLMKSADVEIVRLQ